jgi:DNA polymerase-3 subunit alpha
MTSCDFVHLHNHTEYSFLDGAIRIKDMVKRAVSWGMPALAITDHGGLFGAIEFYQTCMKEAIKPVLGFEAYITPRSRKERSTSKDEKNYHHLILFARNNQGWKNLMRLSSAGYLEGFYYKPRIDMEILRECGEGLIGTSACVAGAIPRALLAGNDALARDLAREYLSIFGEGNFYLELQNHGIDEEIVAAEQLITLGKELGIPFIVANDAHYLDKKDAASHEVLLALQTGSLLSDPNRFRFSTDEMYFKSPQEMHALFPDLPEAFANTIAIAERCNVTVQAKPQLPVPAVPSEFENPKEYLRSLAEKGLQTKYPSVTPGLEERLNFELDIICNMNFDGYFLIVRDFLMEADRQGIMRGCRGSAAGSLVAFCVGITNVDPIKFDLIFERFLNPERISMPDADIDFADNDRYKIIDYVVNKYGREAVCQIINFGRMKAKMIVKDVARVMDIPIAEANRLSGMVNEKTLAESLKANGELTQLIGGNPRYQELFTHAKVLEGLARQPGMHAGGVIIAPGNVVNWAPLFKQAGKDKEEETIMTQFDMNYVEQVGLIKMDFLGLRTLTVLQETVRLIMKYHGEAIDLWKLPDQDDKAFDLFGRGETVNIFQFESQGMQDYLRKLKPTCIEDLIAMNALYRPGPMDNIDSFIHRKHGKEKIIYPHPLLKEILDVTYGIIIYQEQVMRIAQIMGGFSLGQADILRKAMGKKQADTMEKMGVKFIEGALKQNIDKKVAEEVYALMGKFAEYGFNKAHATVYAHMAYQAGYLKTHYTLEYMTAALTSWIGRKDEFFVTKSEAERMNIKILPPDVNKSEAACCIDGSDIRLGLEAIANVGKAATAIIECREKSGPFNSMFDLCRRVDLRALNKKTLESLVVAGALDSLPGTRAQQFAAAENALAYGSGFQKDSLAGQTDLFSVAGGSADKPTVTIPEPQLPNIPPWPYNEMLTKEKEVLNFYVSGHPLENYRDEIVGFATTPLNSTALEKVANNADVTIGGLITTLRTHVQRDGRAMAFLELDDFEGSIELIAFGDAYEKFRHLLAVDAMVLVRGAIMKEEEKKSKLRVEKVIALSESREKLARSVHIRLRTQGLEEDFIKEIRRHCSQTQGSCSLIIHLVTQERNEYKIRAKDLMVSPNKEVIEQIRLKVGRENVWLGRTAA